jgi:hypothetical protein
LDQNLLNQYENYFQMFRTEGWKQFVEDMQAIYDSHRIEDIKDDVHLAYVKGERRILWQVLQFESAIQQNYNLASEQSDD